MSEQDAKANQSKQQSAFSAGPIQGAQGGLSVEKTAMVTYPLLFWALKDGFHSLFISTSSVSIGRSEGAQVRIVNPQVSKIHAHVVSEAAGWFIKDNNSANRTFLDGSPILMERLQDGASFVIGGVQFWFFESIPPFDLNTTHLLAFTEGKHAELVVPLAESNVIGHGDGTISLEDPGVEPQHAEVQCLGQDIVFIRDLNTASGTFVNGLRLEGRATRLREGDEIQIGQARALLRVGNPAASVAMAAAPQLMNPLQAQATVVVSNPMEGIPLPEKVPPGTGSSPEPETDPQGPGAGASAPPNDTARTAPRGERSLGYATIDHPGRFPPMGSEPPQAQFQPPTPEAAPTPPKRSRSTMLLVLAILLLAAAIAGAVMVTQSSGPAGKMVQVPTLVGQKETDARAVAKNLGLKLAVDGTQNHPNVALGAIFQQTPTAGTRIAEGGTLRVLISAGPAELAVPNLVGLGLEEARAKLEKLNLAVGPITRHPSLETPQDHVLATDPAPETAAEVGTEVRLTLSDGPPQVTVPNVVNRRESVAKQLLKKAGLTLGKVSYTYDDTKGGLVVLQQDPGAEQQVAPGTAVSLVVNEGG